MNSDAERTDIQSISTRSARVVIFCGFLGGPLAGVLVLIQQHVDVCVAMHIVSLGG